MVARLNENLNISFHARILATVNVIYVPLNDT